MSGGGPAHLFTSRFTPWLKCAMGDLLFKALGE